MKRLCLILLLAVLAITTNAQTIHWLTFIDTKDPNVGELDKRGRFVLYNRFIHVINAALAEKGYKSNIQDYYDTQMSPHSCKSAVENLQCGPDDIIVFYYIGHGTHAKDESNPYPQMLLGCNWDEESKFIPLNWVHQQLKGKNARLAVTIGMCCNTVQGATAKEGPTFKVNYGNTYLTETEKNAIQKMFLQHEGDFILSSASVGQSSIGGMIPPFGAMDFFTAILVRNFENYAYEGNLDWNVLFNDVREMIDRYTRGEQTPIFESNIRPVSAPTQKERKPVTPEPQESETTSTSSTSADLLNSLAAAFDYLIDVNQSDANRIEQGQKVCGVFTVDAVVKTLGQDGDVVVDKSSAEDFIGRISTSRILLKIVPVDYKLKGGKISELRVKEVYIK